MCRPSSNSAPATCLSPRSWRISTRPKFGGRAGLSGPDRFTQGEWRVLATGAPVYCDALGVFDCAVEEILERGDIFIIVGKVVAVVSRADGDPLIFFRGKSHAGLGTLA